MHSLSLPFNLDNTLEQLENIIWPEPEYDSHLVVTCHNLRKIPLKDFTIEDLRIMIGQSISLEYLIPIAIDHLSENVLAEGDFYPGDLLSSVLSSEQKFWLQNNSLWTIVLKLYQDNKLLFENNSLYKQLRKNFSDFEAIHKSNDQ